MTTKKDFVQAAKEISLIPDKNQKEEAANLFVQIFSKQNPRFDKARFLTACGI